MLADGAAEALAVAEDGTRLARWGARGRDESTGSPDAEPLEA
jgi:hypothetical protein